MALMATEQRCAAVQGKEQKHETHFIASLGPCASDCLHVRGISSAVVYLLAYRPAHLCVPPTLTANSGTY